MAQNDLIISYPENTPPVKFDFINPFFILVYDDVHSLPDNQNILFYNNGYIIFDHTSSFIRDKWSISESNNRYILDSTFNSSIKYWYFENLSVTEFVGNVLDISNSSLPLSTPFLWKCITCQTASTPLERETPHTLVNGLSLLSEDRGAGVFIVRRKDLLSNPVQVLNDIFDYADYFNKNFYVDTGLGMVNYFSQLQMDIVKEQLHVHNRMLFGVVNTPFRTNIGNLNVNIPNTLNLFVSAGYVVKNAKSIVAQIDESLSTSSTIDMSNLIMSITPASIYYFSYVYYMYSIGTPYRPIINKIISDINGGFDVIFKYKDTTFRNWAKTNRINPLIFKTGERFTLFLDNLSAYNSSTYSPLQEEHWARLSIDVGYYSKFVLKNIIGLSSEMNENEIRNNIIFYKHKLYEDIFSKANLGFNDFRVEYEIENDKMFVSVFAYLPATIKEIKLTTVVI
ncbi:MAG: hypothetical protein QXF12_00250 [Candidatus Aenigmatarchaeota archaeon]